MASDEVDAGACVAFFGECEGAWEPAASQVVTGTMQEESGIDHARNDVITVLTLTTPRLVLRAFTDGDVPAVHEYASDPDVCRYVTFGPNRLVETQAFVQRCMAAPEGERVKYDFAVVLRDSGHLIGGCGLYLKDRAQQAWFSANSLSSFRLQTGRGRMVQQM